MNGLRITRDAEADVVDDVVGREPEALRCAAVEGAVEPTTTAQ